MEGAPLPALVLLEMLADSPDGAVLDLPGVEAQFRFLGFGSPCPSVDYLVSARLARLTGEGIELVGESRGEVLRWLGGLRWSETISLGAATVSWRVLAGQFAGYLRGDRPGEGPLAGGAVYRHRSHALTVVVRLSPAGIGYLPPGFDVLVITPLAGREQAAADILLRSPAVRGRVGLYDLGKRLKMSLSLNPLFTLFEWFLRDEYRWRPAPSTAFTEALVRAGVLVLDT
ncbi:MAG: hypothetical protein AB1446_04780 [Bacillota bacterium]